MMQTLIGTLDHDLLGLVISGNDTASSVSQPCPISETKDTVTYITNVNSITFYVIKLTFTIKVQLVQVTVLNSRCQFNVLLSL